MNDGELLLRAILTNPDDDTARLVYADWLQEQGAVHLALFIRVQVELATHISSEHGGVRHYHAWALGRRTVELERRERDLLLSIPELECEGFIQVRSHDYFGAMDSHKTAAFRRGFIESLKCPAADFLDHAAAIFAAHPVTSVQLTDYERFLRGWHTPEFWWADDCLYDHDALPADLCPDGTFPSCAHAITALRRDSSPTAASSPNCPPSSRLDPFPPFVPYHHPGFNGPPGMCVVCMWFKSSNAHLNDAGKPCFPGVLTPVAHRNGWWSGPWHEKAQLTPGRARWADRAGGVRGSDGTATCGT